MKTLLRTIAAMAVLAAAGAGMASAQNFNQNPTYGSVNLSAGFSPDPMQVTVRSGGSINAAQSIGGACTGYIANAPDYRVNYTPGSYPLIISVNSSQDTTLIVNGPDSRWYCDDDSGNAGLNPMVRFNQPASGQYDIWIGTYGSNQNFNSTLAISEVSSQ
ncbi:MAG: peptidase S1 [Caulobacterales bacterium]